MPDFIPIILKLKEKSGKHRFNEPVSMGVPFPKGKIKNISTLIVQDQNNTAIPFATEILDHWSDGSIKWVLFDFQASLFPKEEKLLHLSFPKEKKKSGTLQGLTIQENKNEYIVETGTAQFTIDRHQFKPFNSVYIDGQQIINPEGSFTTLTDDKKAHWIPDIQECCIEKQNPLKIILFFKGCFSKKNINNDLQFQARLSFFSGHGFCSCELTILNPKAAIHPDGFWDLGNPGSSYFKELSSKIILNSEGPFNSSWKVDSTSEIQFSKENIRIYQDSSGGENWQSKNHVNRLGEIPVSFKGYRVFSQEKIIHEGLRASPVLSLSENQYTVAATIRDFWQNFPSAIESDGKKLKISLFPKQFNDVFELQGGEQKNQEFFFSFSAQAEYDASLDWVHEPVTIVPNADWYAGSKAMYCLIPEKDIPSESPYPKILDLIRTGIQGDNSFVARREIIDEYGWRNFGDLYADHENRLYLGEKPIISHYNNQYDMINSFVFQYISGENENWFDLARDLAKHVVDIDIYHASLGSDIYSQGLFWHTDHFASAGTATHRSFSKSVIEQDKQYTIEDGIAAAYKHFGGGPSAQHVYTNGLTNYYFLTGDKNAKKGTIEIAKFVSKSVQGPNRPIPVLKKIIRNTLNWVKDRSGSESNRPYSLAEGPDRGSGNALNILVDAFILEKKDHYLKLAEVLIRKCVHPNDDLRVRNLLEINTRWSYTIFFQGIGKFLDLKSERQEFDDIFFYARDALFHYAGWMIKHEVPIMTLSDAFDFPNHATRAANDIRKANVLFIASKYAPEDKKAMYQNKAVYFFKIACNGLIEHDTSTLTRPLAILMQNINTAFQLMTDSNQKSESNKAQMDYGKPMNRRSIGWLVKENFNLLVRLIRSE